MVRIDGRLSQGRSALLALADHKAWAPLFADQMAKLDGLAHESDSDLSVGVTP
jgi:hypothetical protein